MSAPSPATIARTRFWLLLVVRLLALFMAGLAIYGFVMSLSSFCLFVVGALTGASMQLWEFIRGFAEVFAPSFAPALLAFLLFRYDRRIVHFLAATPGTTCPSCGYPLRGLKFAICPECGTAVAPAGAEAAPSSPPPAQRQPRA